MVADGEHYIVLYEIPDPQAYSDPLTAIVRGDVHVLAVLDNLSEDDRDYLLVCFRSIPKAHPRATRVFLAWSTERTDDAISDTFLGMCRDLRDGRAFTARPQPTGVEFL